MDSVKEAVADSVQRYVQRKTGEGWPELAELYDGPVEFEAHDIGPLITRLRVKPVGGRGPRYFDITVKETL
jgi:hypothetical protein